MNSYNKHPTTQNNISQVAALFSKDEHRQEQREENPNNILHINSLSTIDHNFKINKLYLFNNSSETPGPQPCRQALEVIFHKGIFIIHKRGEVKCPGHTVFITSPGSK